MGAFTHGPWWRPPVAEPGSGPTGVRPEETERHSAARPDAAAGGAPILSPCPTEDAERARRAMVAAFEQWAAHVRTCNGGCVPHQSLRCATGQRLACAYLDGWKGWLAAAREAATPAD